ncbi:EAL domain-containing protein [Microbaculum marinisediminis]|uniref:EAL domain-containing protein n=1 Tax=Microbaculum marinisediminis TaxID=2931392 RepID=A0AAW5QVR9_9HYPH|nr:EAL domain-containing protein [Microbaculum sp. A6E488]MCT8970399.1 EAL domain-containing protein [Microbaculum sp. A6E488]
MSVSSPVEADTLRGPDEPRSVLPSPSPWFVAFCMVVIAGSLATILYARAGMSVAEAGWIGFAALLIMVLAEFYSARARERSAVEAELREVVRVSGRFQDEIAGLNQRIADIEATLTVRVDDMIEERVETIVTDMRQIEDRLDGLAETVSALESAAPAARGALAGAEIGGRAETLEESPAFPGMSDADAAAILRRSVEEHGPLIHLQSIVTLPQRRVRYYEAFARLRTDDGRSLMPRQFIPLAERTGIMPIIDNAVLFRTVQILRKIARKNNDVGIFCNISARSLGDGEFFQQFVDFMGENRNLAGAIVFEFTQAAFDDLGPIELANLDALAELGFRFSLDNVNRLDIDGARLAKHGVRYIKIDADTLMQPPLSASAHIHAADLAKLLARYGITLIATRVEAESQVVDILDYDVKFAQGNLFSPPRIVRADAAQAARKPTIN